MNDSQARAFEEEECSQAQATHFCVQGFPRLSLYPLKNYKCWLRCFRMYADKMNMTYALILFCNKETGVFDEQA
jgi:hypothetical protein